MALELPARVRMQLVEWRSAAIGDRDDLRLVAADSLHVTLAFLGSRPVEEVEAIGRRCRARWRGYRRLGCGWPG